MVQPDARLRHVSLTISRQDSAIATTASFGLQQTAKRLCCVKYSCETSTPVTLRAPCVLSDTPSLAVQQIAKTLAHQVHLPASTLCVPVTSIASRLTGITPCTLSDKSSLLCSK